MKTKLFFIIGITIFFVNNATASAQNTSTRLFNVYANSIENPEYFDQYFDQHLFDDQIRSCINGLSATYVPIAKKHLDLCWNIANWETKKDV